MASALTAPTTYTRIRPGIRKNMAINDPGLEKWVKVGSDLKLRNPGVYRKPAERSDSITLVSTCWYKTKPLSGANQCPVLWAGFFYLIFYVLKQKVMGRVL